MSRTHASKALWLGAIRTDGPLLRAALERAAAGSPDLSTDVPSCPDWTVRDLINHLATQYREVRSHVSRGVTSRPEEPEAVPEDLPTGVASIQWLMDEHQQLLELLDKLDPQLPAWNWAPQAKQAAFWQRRMAHETAVHRWDAQTAVGQVEPLEAKLATDGVAEVLDTLLPAGRRHGPADRAGVVQLVATDPAHEWFVRLRGEGVALLDTDSWLDHDDHGARAVARGTASDLLLALFGRVPFEVLEVSGEAELLAALRTG